MEGDRPLCSRGIALSYGFLGEVKQFYILKRNVKLELMELI